MAIEQTSADKCRAAALFIAAHRRRVHVYDGMVQRADDYGLAVGVDDRAEELAELKRGRVRLSAYYFPFQIEAPPMRYCGARRSVGFCVGVSYIAAQ